MKNCPKAFIGFCALLFSLNILAQEKWDGKEALMQLNSSYNESNPIMSPDGKRLYFTRSGDPLNIGGIKDKGDIWFSEKTENGWSSPVHGGSLINNLNYNAVIGFSPDGRQMYLHGKYTGGLEKGVSRSVLTSSGEWSRPAIVDIPYFKDQSEIPSGSIYFNGQIILLSLQRFDSYGNEDIYIGFLQGGTEWSELYNLGNMINTKAQEFSPYLDKNGQRLYFSSNGHAGQGSLDVFYSDRLTEGWQNWSKPQAIDGVVNSTGKDWYFHKAGGDSALFVSSSSSESYGNIYVVKKKENAVQNEVDTRFEVPTNENEYVQLLVQINNGVTNELISDANISSTATEHLQIDYDSINNVFQLEMLDNATYPISIKSEGFLKKQFQINTDSIDDNSLISIKLLPLSAGIVVQLNNIFFIRGKAEMLENSEDELYNLLEVLQENPNLTIEISGHTDNQGLARVNIKLSQARAETVKEWLVNRGVEADRLETKGYGGSRPIASNESEESRQLNRRVEFKILDN